jgi:hypothetical protein
LPSLYRLPISATADSLKQIADFAIHDNAQFLRAAARTATSDPV